MTIINNYLWLKQFEGKTRTNTMIEKFFQFSGVFETFLEIIILIK